MNEVVLEQIYEELLEEVYADCEETVEMAHMIFNERAR